MILENVRRALGLSAAITLLQTALAFASSQPSGCKLRGAPDTLADVEIAPTGAKLFTLVLHHVDVEVQAEGGSTRMALRADGILRFTGTSRSVPFAIARATATERGIVTLAKSSRLERVRGSGDAFKVDAGLGFGVTVMDVHVPCDAMSLGEPALPGADRAPPLTTDDTYWIPKRTHLEFRAAPAGGASVLVRMENEALFSMSRVAHRNGWSRLYWDGEGVARIIGWVPDSDVRPMPLGSIGGAPTGVGHMGCLPGRAGGTRVYRGPARIAVGTTVYAEPLRGAWATVHRDATVQILRFADTPWVQVVEIEGLEESCRTMTHAYVPVNAVHLPEGVRWP